MNSTTPHARTHVLYQDITRSHTIQSHRHLDSPTHTIIFTTHTFTLSHLLISLTHRLPAPSHTRTHSINHTLPPSVPPFLLPPDLTFLLPSLSPSLPSPSLPPSLPPPFLPPSLLPSFLPHSPTHQHKNKHTLTQRCPSCSLHFLSWTMKIFLPLSACALCQRFPPLAPKLQHGPSSDA